MPHTSSVTDIISEPQFQKIVKRCLQELIYALGSVMTIRHHSCVISVAKACGHGAWGSQDTCGLTALLGFQVHPQGCCMFVAGTSQAVPVCTFHVLARDRSVHLLLSAYFLFMRLQDTGIGVWIITVSCSSSSFLGSSMLDFNK